jgi:hypothetical protein
LGHPREALVDAIKWLGFKPDDKVMNAFALARALETNNIQIAETIAKRFVAYFPFNASAHMGRAKVYLRKEDCFRARLEFDRAREYGYKSSPEETNSFLSRCP